MNRQPLTPEQYSELVSRMTPPSRFWRGIFRAFWTGGTICCIGQALTLLGGKLNLGEVTTPMFTSGVLIFIATTLTGIGVFDVIGKYAGAGSAVPITGFANSVAAPAIEYKREGAIMGVGAKLFSLAGPVLAYGITSSVFVGIGYWIAKRWFL